MGVVRKVVSVSSLGLVPFRSKKERLRRAESEYRKAAEELAGERLARADADRRVAAAERRTQEAELMALREAKSAAKHGRRADRAERGRKRRHGRHRKDHPVREQLTELVATVQPMVEAGAAEAGRRGREAGRRGRVAAKRAAKAAEKAAERATAKAEKAATKAAKRVKEKVEA